MLGHTGLCTSAMGGQYVQSVGIVWYGMVQQHSLQKIIQSARYSLFHHRLHHFSSRVLFCCWVTKADEKIELHHI